MKDLFVIILAGGLGKRMNSETPKVLHTVHGLPMLLHVIRAANELKPKKILLVVGKYKALIRTTLESYIDNDNDIGIGVDDIEFVDQHEPSGTGNAVLCCKDFLLRHTNNSKTIILSGDVPLIESATLTKMVERDHQVSILTTSFINPTGYGRIVMKNDVFQKIVEEKECDEREKDIQLVNAGIYLFDTDILCRYVGNIKCNNSQAEYYITDIFETIKECNIDTMCIDTKSQYQIMGINTQRQLEDVNAL